MNVTSSLWRNRTRTARLLTFAAVTALLMTGCASDQTNTSRQAEDVNAGLVGSEQSSASPAPVSQDDEDAVNDSEETTDENPQANQTSPEATPSDNESESVEPIESTKPSDDRVGSWVSYKTRNCVTNATSENIVLEWDSNMQNGKSEYLKPSELKKTLGPSAFDCAVSYATFNGETGYFNIEGKALKTENIGTELYFSFPGEPVRPVRSDKFAALTWADESKPGRSLKARASTTDELVKYDQIKVYPIEIRISETQTSSG